MPRRVHIGRRITLTLRRDGSGTREAWFVLTTEPPKPSLLSRIGRRLGINVEY